MIPEFDAWGNLPPGKHWAHWKELVSRYGTNAVRKRLLSGLREALLVLQRAGCQTVYVNGSFVTANDCPADFDACWEIDGTSLDLLDPVLLDFSSGRVAQKRKFAGELFPVLPPQFGEPSIFEAFQTDTYTGEPKGLIAIDLGTFE